MKKESELIMTRKNEKFAITNIEKSYLSLFY